MGSIRIDNRNGVEWYSEDDSIWPIQINDSRITEENFFNFIYENSRLKLKEELLWKYFLIPLDLVPYISHYSDFVKEAYPELIFDVVVENRTIEVEGVDVLIPHKQIKVIPCSCTRWTDEGVDLLDAIVENWNVTYPDKQIDFQVAFESFEEFENFRNEQI